VFGKERWALVFALVVASSLFFMQEKRFISFTYYKSLIKNLPYTIQPYSGEWVLPSLVKSAAELSRRVGLSHYTTAGVLYDEGNIIVRQFTRDANYPARFYEVSGNVFILKKNFRGRYKHCEVLAEEDNVLLLNCQLPI
jgi:hypothetical protein